MSLVRPLIGLAVHLVEDGVVWYKLSDAVDYLKLSSLETDPPHLTTYSKVERAVTRNGGYALKSEIGCVSIDGFLCFCFNNRNTHSVCSRVSRSVATGTRGQKFTR